MTFDPTKIATTTTTVNDWWTITDAIADCKPTVGMSSNISDLQSQIDALTKKPEVDPATTTKLDISNGKIFIKHYKDGFLTETKYLMTDIKDVVVHKNTVIVMFTDNTQTVAVLDPEDTFSLEQGISICITKKLLGEDGSSIYNKLIKRALKIKKQNEDAAIKAEKDKEEVKRRKAIALARHQRKKLKRREAQIEMQAEAYMRALQRLHANDNQQTAQH